jgi:hypothetical protein
MKKGMGRRSLRLGVLGVLIGIVSLILLVGVAGATVGYTFTGFYSPVSNTAVNVVKAGSTVGLKFSLDGNQGLSVLSDATFEQANCATGVPTGISQVAATTGNSGFSYDATTDTYNFNWKTPKNAAGTCAQFALALNDGTLHTAVFMFK